jgi:hypothetical protein
VWPIASNSLSSAAKAGAFPFLVRAPDAGATFVDRLLRLTTLRGANDPGSSSYQVELHEAASAPGENLVLLLGWMNGQDLAMLATEWLATVPPEVLAGTAGVAHESGGRMAMEGACRGNPLENRGPPQPAEVGA